MKDRLRKILEESVSAKPLPKFEIERPKVKAHGELSTNLAMVLAKTLKKNPQEVAKEIVGGLEGILKDPEGLIESATVAGGFVNFVFKKKVWRESLRSLVAQGGRFGESPVVGEKSAVIEFVSANPTGPLHIGNARGGPLGDVIASLLEKIGYKVTREYYVNDVGGQIDKLGESVLHWIRYDFQENAPAAEGYQGEYVKELGRHSLAVLGEKIPKDEIQAVHVLGKFGIDFMMREIQKDCEDMGIRFDSWVHEKTLLVDGETERVLEDLKKKGVTLEKDGALWLAANDEFLKDRECVLVRTDGRPTYFANDISYHVRKYRRGFDRIINVWGSNHHGHVPRVQAAVKSLGYDPQKIETVLYQYVRVKRGKDAVKMSKRAGNFVTAREVLDEVGRDAFRFFLLMRAPESHLDFDLSLAKEKSTENPVYYVQYAHARLASIERKAGEQGIPLPPQDVCLDTLDLPEEIEMIRMIHEFPEEVRLAALRLEPHRIPFYLIELVKVFQAYYTKAREDPRYRVLGVLGGGGSAGAVDTSQAKLYLCRALKLTISQGLKLLGVSAPEVMVQEA